jgi:hypothetical membrane protein
MDVGIFPENFPIEHNLFGLGVYLFGALAPITAYVMERKPFNYFSISIGIFSLAMFVLFMAGLTLGLGPGGMQRMFAYPQLLWGIGLGAHMISWEAK